MQHSSTAAPAAKGRSPFSASFYVANTMEIFERLAWYGFFTLSSLYMTSPRSQGGMGFSDQERGFLQGMIPFLLYLLPVLTGALADRYGYRRMFLLSFAIMCPAYYLLGQAEGFWPFCACFLAVAIGAACFKPVVVGTIGRSTDDSNRGLGFGVFYTMVNVGGFLGPLAAGYLRAISWDMVFVMSALWIAINFVPALFLYKEPAPAHKDQRTLAQVLGETREVLGNGRLALLIFPLIAGLMAAAKGGISYLLFISLGAAWLALNLLWNLAVPAQAEGPTPWYRQRMQVGNRRFVAYLLILAGFWMVYNQIFLTLPLYIRDFVDTADLVRFLQAWLPGSVDFLAGVNQSQLAQALPALAAKTTGAAVDWQTLRLEVVNYKVMPPLEQLQAGLQALQQGRVSAAALAAQWAQAYRQVNPEYIINLDFAAIVLLQVFISAKLERLRALPVLVLGTLVLAASMALAAGGQWFALAGLAVVAAVLLFALGEMIASPKSQEYVAAIAPPHKTAMFMGYYFVSMALGNLFGGLLSGWAYGALARQGQGTAMWLLFAALGAATAGALWLFERSLRQEEAQTQQAWRKAA
ncbi:MFS transporter [Massilia sp. W12]|uniref:MFS transporter n=1 Tax=Massilia sp. W12 TaxID=3126507 RepID=UPI0030CE28B6